MQTTIRPAEAKDLPKILEIINHNILHSTAVYDYDTRSLSDIQAWFNERLQSGFPVIVAESGSKIAGYATYGTFRFKVGFRFTVEHSVYVSEKYNGQGIGKLLMAELISLAKKQGLHTMIGCIDNDNKSSIEFHKKFGFTEEGVLRQSGYKFDRWLDLLFMQLMLE